MCEKRTLIRSIITVALNIVYKGIGYRVWRLGKPFNQFSSRRLTFSDSTSKQLENDLLTWSFAFTHSFFQNFVFAQISWNLGFSWCRRYVINELLSQCMACIHPAAPLSSARILIIFTGKTTSQYITFTFSVAIARHKYSCYNMSIFLPTFHICNCIF